MLAGSICWLDLGVAYEQDVAERIAREAAWRGYDASVCCMDTYDVRRLPAEPAVVFVASTAGQVWSGCFCGVRPLVTFRMGMQGELPDNMKAFWRFLLLKSLPPDSLQNVHFAVFGLGDSGTLPQHCFK